VEELNTELKHGTVVIRRQEGQEKRRLTAVVFDSGRTRTTNHQTQYSVAVGAAVRTTRLPIQFLAAEAGSDPWICHSQMPTLEEAGFLNSTYLLQRRTVLLQWMADQQSPSTSRKGREHYRSGSIDRVEMYPVAVAASVQGSQREVE